jgi:hypothetical protein
MYKRITKDEYEIQGNYGYGWETETTEETWKEAKVQAKCYRENVNYPIRIVKKRVKITA